MRRGDGSQMGAYWWIYFSFCTMRIREFNRENKIRLPGLWYYWFFPTFQIFLLLSTLEPPELLNFLNSYVDAPHPKLSFFLPLLVFISPSNHQGSGVPNLSSPCGGSPAPGNGVAMPWESNVKATMYRPGTLLAAVVSRDMNGGRVASPQTLTDH